MMSGSQTLANGFPLVIPTKTQAPTARLVMRNDLGQVVQQWLIRQNKCTLGSSTSCALRCDAPGIAPYHALLVVGARQIFIRALAPKLTRDGSPVNEVLLTDENSHFEIAGHRFELSRGTKSEDQAESRQSNKRMKFTLARPFELDNRKRSEPTEATPAAPKENTSGDGKWMAQLVQAAVEPLECQIQNLLEPIAELQRESRRQRQEYDQRLNAIQNSASAENSFPEQAFIPKEQIEEISARQAASMDVISERISDVNLQLAAIERLVAEDRVQAAQKTDETANQQIVEQFVAQNNAIEQLQSGMVNVAGALQELESRQNSARDEDLAWKSEVQSQIAGLRVSVEELAERARNPEPINDDSAWKSEIQQQFTQLREAVDRVVTASQEREALLTQQIEARSSEWLPAPVDSFSTPTPASAAPNSFNEQESATTDEQAPLALGERERLGFTADAADLPTIEDELRARLIEASQASQSETAQFDSAPESDELSGAFGLPADAPADLDEDTDDQVTNVFESEDALPASSDSHSEEPLNSSASIIADENAFEASAEFTQTEENEFNVGFEHEPVVQDFTTGLEPNAGSDETVDFSNQLSSFADAPAAQVEEEFFFDAADSKPELDSLATGFDGANAPIDEEELAFAGLSVSEPSEESPQLSQPSQTETEQDHEQELIGFSEASPQPTFDSAEMSSLETNAQVSDDTPAQEESEEIEQELPSWWTEDDQYPEGQASDQFTTRDAFAERNPQEGFAITEQEEVPSASTVFNDAASHSPLETLSDEVSENQADDLEEFPTAGLIDESESSSAESFVEPHADLESQPPAELENGLTGDFDEEEFPTAAPMSSLAEASGYAIEEEVSLTSEEPAAAEIQPEASEAETASADDGEDSSVEDYMRKLLARMRGTPEEDIPEAPKPAPVAAPKPIPQHTSQPTSQPNLTAAANGPSDMPVSASPPTTESFGSDGTEPFDPDKYVPRTTAPEKVRNLAAMRELANSSARTAIHKSTRQRNVASIVLKLSIAGIGFIVGGVLIAINGFQVNIGLIATVAAFLVAGIWGYDAATSLKPLLQSGLILQPQATSSRPNTDDDQPSAETTGDTDVPAV